MVNSTVNYMCASKMGVLLVTAATGNNDACVLVKGNQIKRNFLCDNQISYGGVMPTRYCVSFHLRVIMLNF